MNRVLIIVLSIVFLVSMTLTGISCKTETAGEVSSGGTGEEEISFEGKEIALWTQFVEGSFMYDYWQEIAQAYEDERGVKVNVSVMDRDIGTSFRPAVLEGTVPELLDVHINEGFQAVIKEGNALEISDLTKEEVWEGGLSIEDSLIGGILDVWPLEEGSRYYCPYTVFTSGLFYNKTDFEARGFEVPETWSEFMPILEAYKADGVAPFTQDGGVDFYNAYWIYWFANRTAGAGTFLDTALDETGEAWDNPDMLAAAEWVEKISPSGEDYFIKDFNGYVYPAGQVDWAVGKAAFILVGNWVIAETKDKVDPDWEYGFMPFPLIEGGKGDTPEAHPYGFIIPKDCDNPEIAKDFIKFSLSKEWQVKLMDVPFIPVVNGLEDSVPSDTIYSGAFIDMFDMFSKATEVHEMYDKLQGYSEWFTKILLPLDDQLLFGDITAEEFIREIKQEQIDFYNN